MTNWVIQTSGLTRTYKTQIAVNLLNLRVPEGTIYGFLGPNGAGKTTTIRMLLGLIRPTSGDIEIFRKSLAQNRMSILKKVGSLVESPSYYGHLSGFENLAVFARLLDVSDQRIREVLEIVRLTPAANKAVKGYSLGMKQRLGIASALLASPKLLILDEPTNGLDPAGIHEIRQLIIDMPRQHGISVLVSSHLLSEIEQMATWVGIINQGKLLFQDHIQALRQESQAELLIDVDRPQDALAILQREGFEVTMVDKSLVLKNIEYPEYAQVNKKLVLADIPVFRIREHAPSLEDIFLRLVGTGGSL
ncbi:ABC transporter ATP-binding protein [Alicyclobacillus fastidiosus]|uniref:ABC transporter ATP-binding protein n=1 Tax=Alicyclobacillus fastidiosus TaxID=392011 RepID=A0ABV5A8L0_9BACL|nr:ABC transporter ATP-binding protein [Alicyclobacillus fastidiosus]WEH11994.1 ABC transporter ATP-binding protein [Alicyclobacillus fastidiosus]